MKLISTNELGVGEPVLVSDWTPNTLHVRDPNRFPELVPMVQALIEGDLPNGHIYAYLAQRFEGHLNAVYWTLWSRGSAGDRTRELLVKTSELESRHQWSEDYNALPGPWPLRERVLLAWLRGTLPASVLEHAPPIKGRIFASQPFRDAHTARDRAMFRTKR